MSVQRAVASQQWEAKLSDNIYFINMLKVMPPTTYHLESVMRMQFICKHCGYHYPYKYESYHDFSLDLPTLENLPTKQPDNITTTTDDPNTIVIDDDEVDAKTEQPSSCSINELLQRYFAPEERELKCEKCLQGKEIFLHKQLINTPTILVLHLKRFQYSYETQSFTKMYQYSIDCPKRLSFPPAHSTITTSSNDTEASSTSASNRSLDLGYKYNRLKESYHALWKDISSTTSSSIENNESLLLKYDRLFKRLIRVYEEMIQCRKEVEEQLSSSLGDHDATITQLQSNTYQLMAIVRHLGTTISQGHYICDVYYPTTEAIDSTGGIASLDDEETHDTNDQSSKTSTKKGQWFRYNDAIVMNIAEVRIHIP
jgi:hypothetical protein